jgi:hypothetical protein
MNFGGFLVFRQAEVRADGPRRAGNLADSLVERRWVDTGPNGFAGKRIEFMGLH